MMQMMRWMMTMIQMTLRHRRQLPRSHELRRRHHPPRHRHPRLTLYSRVAGDNDDLLTKDAASSAPAAKKPRVTSSLSSATVLSSSLSECL